MKLVEEWANSYKILLNCTANTENLGIIAAKYKAAEAKIRVLPRGHQRVLRLRYIEGASWEGIAQLMGMRATWAERVAEMAIETLDSLFA